MIKEQFISGHKYSVIPKVDKNYKHNYDPNFLDINYNDENNLKVLNELNDCIDNFNNNFGIKLDGKHKYNEIVNQVNEIQQIEFNQNIFKYYLVNGVFEWMDGRLLYYYLSKLKSRKIIEIGSGQTTLLLLNCKKLLNLNYKIICIDQEPPSYIKKLDELGEITLLKYSITDDIELKIFKLLNENDMLLINSSHVLKLNSDVLFYFRKIFPILKKNVYIQISNIFLPYEYPDIWINYGIFWNEQYLLYIFLQNNKDFEIQYSNNYIKYKFNDKLKEIQKLYYENNTILERNQYTDTFTGNTIWIKKIN
jgi:hypothetical protein